MPTDANPPTETVAIALGNLLRAMAKRGDTVVEGHSCKCAIWHAEGCSCSIARRLTEARKALDEYSAPEPDGRQAEIATVTVKDGWATSCVLKAPGLPDGEHDLFCVPPPSEPTPKPMLPDLLFDGYAVMDGLSDQARGRTSWENVADVLDAVVKILRVERSSETKPEKDHG